MSDVEGEAGSRSGPFIEQPFFHTESGIKRLHHELETLRERFQVQPDCCEIDGRSVAIRLRVIREIVLVLPPEFPLNPPSLFYVSSKRRVRELTGSVAGWNSLRTCADLLENALKVINRDTRQKNRGK